MTSTQTIWIGGREPVLAPRSARVVHAQDIALVATATWSVTVLTSSGSLAAPDADTNRKLLLTYFPDLLEEGSGH